MKSSSAAAAGAISKLFSFLLSQEVLVTTLIGYAFNQSNLLSISPERDSECMFVFDSECKITMIAMN